MKQHDSELAGLLWLGFVAIEINPQNMMEGESGETVTARAPGTSSEIPDPFRSGILNDAGSSRREGAETASAGTSREIAPPSTHGPALRHDHYCQCQRCVGMCKALLASNPDGSPFFTYEELARMSMYPVEAWG